MRNDETCGKLKWTSNDFYARQHSESAAASTPGRRPIFAFTICKSARNQLVKSSHQIKNELKISENVLEITEKRRFSKTFSSHLFTFGAWRALELNADVEPKSERCAAEECTWKSMEIDETSSKFMKDFMEMTWNERKTSSFRAESPRSSFRLRFPITRSTPRSRLREDNWLESLNVKRIEDIRRPTAAAVAEACLHNMRLQISEGASV